MTLVEKNKIIQIGKHIWIIDGGNVDFYGFPYSTRSVVVRLKNEDLWVWSPIRLSDDIREEIDKLGRVKHLVSPNKLHYLYLEQWKKAYPESLVWGPESTIKKCPSLKFESALKGEAPHSWKNEIEQFWFNGSFLFEEIVFFHRESRTAIFADMSENFSGKFLKTYWKGWKEKIAYIWKIAEPYGYAPLELRLSWLKKKDDREKMENLLKLRPEKVVMAHGEWQNSNGCGYIQKAFKWLM